MGGWIALHLALLRPERAQALVGIAAAPDFTDWGFTADQKAELQQNGKLELPNPYGDQPQVTHLPFFESGAAMRLLHKPIMLECAVRLIHGNQDGDVPIGVAFKLLEDAHSGDVQLNIIKWGDHRLSKPHEIEAIIRTIAVLAEKLQ
jgi:pimeloyl-ACP methyl ester carboxylesterase